jgi:hypothetical protein
MGGLSVPLPTLEDIPRIKLDITTKEIVELLRECRAGV